MNPDAPVKPDNSLIARRLGIDTLQEPVVYMHRDCGVCRSEGFNAQSRVAVSNGRGHVLATLNVVHGEWLKPGEIGFSEAAWRLVDVEEGHRVHVEHADPVTSFAHVRGKLYGRAFSEAALHEVIADVVKGKYSDVQISALIAACSDDHLSLDETVALTRAMLDVGDRLSWDRPIVVDKHCVGGLPGNRTTPIVVAIATEAGLIMPKTSSRAITSPAGTADTMATLTRVDLNIAEMRRVVESQGGCIVWGGSVRLSPADDVLIRVERSLDIDSEPQLIASVLSKKAAAGSTHVVLDIPVGPTAKVRSQEDARHLSSRLLLIGKRIGLHIRPIVSDGLQPVGWGIGPSLEARDVLDILNQTPGAPADLRERSLDLAGEVLELGGACGKSEGRAYARKILESGRALKRFVAICEAQGGFWEPQLAPYSKVIESGISGRIASIDNRLLARIAKLAGAPADPTAGLEIHGHLNDRIEKGQPLFTVHAESTGELEYALAYYRTAGSPFQIGEIDEASAAEKSGADASGRTSTP